MNKNLLYLFTALCTLTLFTACGDDDDKPTDESWMALSSTYQLEKLDATLNETALVTGDGRTVTVNATSTEAATVTLNNVVPDGKEVVINAELTKTNELYSLSGENTINGAKLVVTGTFESGVLTLNIIRSMTTELTGTWNLNFKTMQAMAVQIGDVYVDFQSVDTATNKTVNQQLPDFIGMKLAQKVNSVKALLKEDGSFDVKWTKVGETTETGMPSFVASLVKIQYVVTDGKLMLALDKNLLANPVLAPLISTMLEQYGLSLQQLIGLMEDLGGYYALPINYTKREMITFYVDKTFLVKAMTTFGPMLTPILPAELAPMITGIMQLLPTAEKAEVGLVFKQ